MKNSTLLIAITAGCLILGVLGFVGWNLIKEEGVGLVAEPSGGTLPVFPSVGGGSSVNSGGSGPEGTATTSVPKTPAVYQISAKPVSGYTVTRSGGEWVARYVDRASGHIYESSLERTSNKRLSIITIPETEEAIFTSSTTILFRSEGDDGSIETTYRRMLASTTDGFFPLVSTGLPRNISWLTTRGSDLFYLQKDEEGGAAGFLMNLDKRTSSRTFSYPLSEWIPKLVAGNKVFLQAKASAYIPGGVFLLSGNATNPTALLLGLYGLAALPDDTGTRAMISQTVAGLPQLSTLDVATKKLLPVLLNTFAEKCVWGVASSSAAYCGAPQSLENGVYPDQWYTGERSFSDTLWRIDATSRNLVLVEKFEGKEVDMVSLSVSPEDRYLLFINKKDLSLWSVRLKD